MHFINPVNTVNAVNTVKRLSFPSNNLNVNNEDLVKVRDEYFETMSTKSIESQQTVNSKISLISSSQSYTSNKSSYISYIHGNYVGSNINGGHIISEHDEKRIKQMRFDNAEMHLNVEQLKLEKKYYQQILQSVEKIVIKQQRLELGNDRVDHSLIEKIQHILSAEN